ncbi:hypothetical protein CRV24_005194 [Beauveria bassiana]|nr:hypothetical protein CRV24_005194 [Beauveria bassiana]KAH8709876.1 hypothetical protein HC256_009783 [Beauveria bassiana]
MKFSHIASLAALVSGSLAATLVEVVSGAIDKADKDTLALTAAVKAFSGDIKPVVAAADALIKDVQASKSLIDSTPGKPLTLGDVADISGPASQLWQDSGALVAALTARKTDVEKGNYCSLVQGQTKTIYTASIALIDTITGRRLWPV